MHEGSRKYKNAERIKKRNATKTVVIEKEAVSVDKERLTGEKRDHRNVHTADILILCSNPAPMC